MLEIQEVTKLHGPITAGRSHSRRGTGVTDNVLLMIILTMALFCLSHDSEEACTIPAP